MGRFFHLTKYSLMLLFLNLFYLNSSISFGISTNCRSSSKGGNSSIGMMCLPMALFKQDTWKTLCILLPCGRSSSYATTPTFLFTLYGPKKRGWRFYVPLLLIDACLYGWSLKYNKSPYSNVRSTLFFSACTFY